MKNLNESLKSNLFNLSKDGETKFTGTENECFLKLQRMQGQSADWAMKYEGWKVEPVKEKSNLRAVKVTYSSGDVVKTSMAAHLTDEEILNYFKVGKYFNIGSVSDNMQKVISTEILK